MLKNTEKDNEDVERFLKNMPVIKIVNKDTKQAFYVPFVEMKR